MTTVLAEQPRPRSVWLAFVLNTLLPPTGYAYVGAWRWVLAAVVGISVGPLAVMAWTVTWPPGIFLLDRQSLAVMGLILAPALGFHAAWIARRAPGPTGASRALLYLTPWMGLAVLSMVLRAYGPFATHTLNGEAMAPGLRAGDVVLADQPRAACGEAVVRQGDVVLYRRGADLYPARAIAGPGQTLWMTDGGPVVDGRAIDRRLLGSEPAAGLTVRAALLQEALPGGRSWRVHDLETGGGLDAIAPVTVPAGTWYLLGDNRDNAVDSRTHGPVRTQDICAVVVKILSAKDFARVGLQP